MKEEKIFTDRSEIHRTYMCIYGTLGICLLGYLAMTVRYIWNTHQLPWLDIFTEVLLFLFLASTAMARSTYELHDKELVVISSSLFRTRKLAIPYSAIDGAFHFKVEPIKTIAYRHTYRMYGSMDKREIWSLVYNMPNTDKVSRVLMKASEEFWEEFEKRLPGRIRVSQEEVLKHAYYHISGADLKKNRNRAKKAAAAAEAAEAAETASAETAPGAKALPEDVSAPEAAPASPETPAASLPQDAPETETSETAPAAEKPAAEDKSAEGTPSSDAPEASESAKEKK